MSIIYHYLIIIFKRKGNRINPIYINMFFTFNFRNQLMWFNIYLAFLSYLQFTYQRGCLYRLKSLGLRNNEMDITIDGFHSWMWKGIYNFKFEASSRAGQVRFGDPIVPPKHEIVVTT